MSKEMSEIINHRPVYPIFIRTRTVELVKNQFLVCDCGFWQRFGIPCRHIIHICRGHVSLDDFALRWRKDYLAFYLEPGYEEFSTICDYYTDNPPLGPIYNPEYCHHFSLLSQQMTNWILQPSTILNGVSGFLYCILSVTHKTSSKITNNPQGLSQEISLSQNIDSNNQASHSTLQKANVQKANEMSTIPPGGAYNVLAPVFHSLSSLAEFDRENLELSMNGLKRVHEEVSVYIKNKHEQDSTNDKGDISSSNHKTSRGQLSKLKKTY
eukprot:scaffold194612_cov64-Attheya_sp.AAC.2